NAGKHPPQDVGRDAVRPPVAQGQQSIHRHCPPIRLGGSQNRGHAAGQVAGPQHDHSPCREFLGRFRRRGLCFGLRRRLILGLAGGHFFHQSSSSCSYPPPPP